MTPENFGYELGWAALGEVFGDDDGCEAARAMGESIVETAEMQAIRAAFLMLVVDISDANHRHNRLRNRYLLPEVVVDWVLA